MGLRFRKSFKLFPGVRVNVGLRGVSTSFGVRGASINVGRRGVRANVGIPGTGLSYSQRLDGTSPRSAAPADDWPSEDTPEFVPMADIPPLDDPGSPTTYPTQQLRTIGSKAVEALTSPSLRAMRDMLSEARAQMAEIEAELAPATARLKKLEAEYARKQKSFFRPLHKRRIAKLRSRLGPEAQREVDRLEAWRDSTQIDVDFATPDAAQRAWGTLVHAFDNLRGSALIWDVTADRDVDRAAERSTAKRAIERTPVTLDYAVNDVIRFDGRALQFGNANGEPLLFYPGVVLMPRLDGPFALIDPREVTLDASAVRFVEDGPIPTDATRDGHTWLKANKDGSPDRRFQGNRQIPVCLYGRFVFTTPGGLTEEYQFSNVEAAGVFAALFTEYQQALATG